MRRRCRGTYAWAVSTDAEREQYESAEQAFLQAIREQQNWSTLRSTAANLSAKATIWDQAEHAAWRSAKDEEARGSLAASTDATELISAIWRDVALAFGAKDGMPY
jgi:hypothetical protein